MPWSFNDNRFLRSLRIVADEPAPPSPRFVVDPTLIDGEYQVIDREKRCRPITSSGKVFRATRAAAENFANYLNEKHPAEKRGTE